VVAVSDTGNGVDATSSTGRGVSGFSDSHWGVVGRVGTDAESPDDKHPAGVFGGSATIDAAGVHARATVGIGVLSESGQVALDARGEVRFSTSGTVVIPSGEDHVAVTYPGELRAGSHILCTLQTDPGTLVAVSYVEKTGTTHFTIHLTGNTSQDTTAFWFVIGGGLETGE
jgi:hypothetical protein